MSYDPTQQPTFSAPAAAGPPQISGVEESVTTSSTVTSGGRGGRFAIGGLVAALAIGGGFAVRTALSDPAGPATADEAVTQMFQALDDDDLVGIAEVLHPGERQSISEPDSRCSTT